MKFFDEKAVNKKKTPYGMEYSPQYQQMSREQQKAGAKANDNGGTKKIKRKKK